MFLIRFVSLLGMIIMIIHRTSNINILIFSIFNTWSRCSAINLDEVVTERQLIEMQQADTVLYLIT